VNDRKPVYGPEDWTGDPARQLQVCDIGAADQQKKSDASHEGEERLVHMTFKVAQQLLA